MDDSKREKKIRLHNSISVPNLSSFIPKEASIHTAESTVIKKDLFYMVGNIQKFAKLYAID